jgi:hypothetical protein
MATEMMGAQKNYALNAPAHGCHPIGNCAANFSVRAPGRYRERCSECERGERDKAFSVTVEIDWGLWHCLRCPSSGSWRQNSRYDRARPAYTGGTPTERHLTLASHYRDFWRSLMPPHGVAREYLQSRGCALPPAEGSDAKQRDIVLTQVQRMPRTPPSAEGSTTPCCRRIPMEKSSPNSWSTRQCAAASSGRLGTMTLRTRYPVRKSQLLAWRRFHDPRTTRCTFADLIGHGPAPPIGVWGR